MRSVWTRVIVCLSLALCAATPALAQNMRSRATPPNQRKWADGSDARQGLLIAEAGIEWYFEHGTVAQVELNRQIFEAAMGGSKGSPFRTQAGAGTSSGGTELVVQAAGEFNFRRDFGESRIGILGGPRVLIPLEKFGVWAETLIGVMHWSGDSDLTIQPGFGMLYAITKWGSKNVYLDVNFRIPFDIYEGGHTTYKRLSFGIGIPIWGSN